MRKRIFLLVVGIMCGIGLFINFETLNVFYVIFISFIISLLSLLFSKNLFILPLSIGLGFFLSFNQFSSFNLKDQGLIEAQLTIVEKRQTGDSYRYFVKVKNKDLSEKAVIFSEDSYEIGQMFLVEGRASAPKRNTNPNLFNYRNYLASKDIGASLDIVKIKKEAMSKSKALALRRNFYNYIHKIFDNNLNPEASKFIISVILGENLLDSDELRDLGLAHILAVSGLHIDMLMGFILYILAKLNVDYKKAYVFALGICLVYGYAIGFPFSVIRVFIINTIGFLAFLFAYPVDKLKSLMVAALLILLVNPFALLNAGFVLSFVATSGVYLVYPRLKIYFPKSLIGESIGFTTAIQLTLLPFTIFYYGKVNLISILANFLIVPVFTLAMYIVFGLIILYPLLSLILGPIFWILDYLLNSILNLTTALGRIGFLSFDFAHPTVLATVYLYVLLLVSLYIKKTNKKLVKNFYAASLLIVVLSLGYDILHPELSYTMVDIGQGDAFILNDGGDIYLIDVGGPKFDDYDSGEKILVPYLESLGIKEIKAIFISHEDMDHSGNLDIIYDNFKVGHLITNEYNADGLSIFNPHIMDEGDNLKLKNGYIKCVYSASGGSENSESMGLLIDMRGVKILTLGDLDMEYEDKLDLKADILKVSHHGSKNSTSRFFVETVNPKAALISAGRNNRYGHPTKEVLDNLTGVKIYNSQDRGMVKIVFDDEVRIESYLKGGYFR